MATKQVKWFTADRRDFDETMDRIEENVRQIDEQLARSQAKSKALDEWLSRRLNQVD